MRRGFSLVELSIVLVILGLLVGGILAGQSLINAAAMRQQIRQIDSLNVAVNNFRDRYAAIPGDLSATTAAQLGLTVNDCNGINGRNGNGVLGDSWTRLTKPIGENALFWADLISPVAGNLINESLPNNAQLLTCAGTPSPSLTPVTNVKGSLVGAKLRDGLYINAYPDANGVNWYGIQAGDSIDGNGYYSNTTPGIAVIEAYQMDRKMDDGLPTSGKVRAYRIAGCCTTGPVAAPNVVTSGGDATSCYDTTTNQYSIGQNSGTGLNCAFGIMMGR